MSSFLIMELNVVENVNLTHIKHTRLRKKIMKSVNLDKVNRVTFVKIVPKILFPRERLNLGLSCVRDNGNITRSRLHTFSCSCESIEDIHQKNYYSGL